jgi:hypothetical protein
MKHGSFAAWLLVLGLTATTGCAFVASRRENPVIEDRIGIWTREPLGTLATTAERRIVLVRLNDSSSTVGRVCAEPPPDASENIASQLSTALEAAFKQPSANVDATARVDATRGIATSVQSLFQRTQGLQLYRDGMYNLCQGFMNGIFDKFEFKEKYDSLLARSAGLIEKEIDVTNGSIGGPKAPSTSDELERLEKLMGMFEKRREALQAATKAKATKPDEKTAETNTATKVSEAVEKMTK